jgi:hypothetical protein
MDQRIFPLAVAIIAPLLMASTCDDKSGATRESQQTQRLQEQAAVVVGMPAILNFAEKRMLKRIYELRDDPHYVTYSYYLDMFGDRHKACPGPSIGYPFPYSTQYTAPKAPRIMSPLYPDGTQGTQHTWDADQPEPNGLYMPTSADATWIACYNATTKEIAITYSEPKIMTYPFPMPNVDDGTAPSPLAALVAALIKKP